MTENKKEQVLKKEISMEMAEEVVGGGKEFFGGDEWGGGETELGGGGDFGGFGTNGGSKPAGGGGGFKPAEPDGGTHTKNDNITNINNGGQQKIVNQGRNNSVTGNEIKM